MQELPIYIVNVFEKKENIQILAIQYQTEMLNFVMF